MSEITNVLSKLSGTRESEILIYMEENYECIKKAQDQWYKETSFSCPDGCGECCRNFEPDLLECEAVYMAAWLIENQLEVAKEVAQGNFPYPRPAACQFWNETSPYHCSIYGARPSICRLFGACSNRDKNGQLVYKPCRFYPAEKLSQYNSKLAHRQYSQEQALEFFKTLPPVMSDLMEPVISINPNNNETKLIRDILPQTIQKLLWIIDLAG